MERKLSQLISGSTKAQAVYRENYDHIVLSEDEIQEALRQARAAKDVQLRKKAYWEKISSEPKYLKLDAVGFKNMIMATYPHLRVDNQAERIFQLLFAYFMGDEWFEKQGSGYSLEKGIMLVGPVGVGKTFILKAFSNNPKLGFRSVNAREISKEFAVDGFDAVDKYMNASRTAPDIFGNQEIGLFIDDLGTEESRKNFGNETNPIVDIILNRYDRCPTYFTHFTSNMNSKEISEAYGSRVTSRLREMVNFIEYKGQDRRK